jgi:hypothetical protein
MAELAAFLAFLAFLAALAACLTAAGYVKVQRPTGAQRKAWREARK